MSGYIWETIQERDIVTHDLLATAKFLVLMAISVAREMTNSNYKDYRRMHQVVFVIEYNTVIQ